MMAGSTEASPVLPRVMRSSKFSEDAKESPEMQPQGVKSMLEICNWNNATPPKPKEKQISICSISVGSMTNTKQKQQQALHCV